MVPPLTKTLVRPASTDAIGEAARLILAGQPVAMPTETVYGLAADATNGTAVAGIYTAKGRPSFNPLIVHVSGPEMASQLVEMSDAALRLMERFWPGPLTIVLPLKPGGPVSSLVTAGLGTLAVRCPDHPVAQALIAAVAKPLAAPSANTSGRITPTSAAHVLKTLNGRIPLILDGGTTRAGIESTIVAIGLNDEITLLREGAFTAEELGIPLRPAALLATSIPTAPGQLASHYAPRQPVRLNASSAGADEYLIGFGAIAGDANLSPSADLTEAAAKLFGALHLAEESGKACIAVAPIPETGLGRAINDRLRRAAAERPADAG